MDKNIENYSQYLVARKASDINALRRISETREINKDIKQEFKTILAYYLDTVPNVRRDQVVSWGFPPELTVHITFHEGSMSTARDITNILINKGDLFAFASLLLQSIEEQKL